jgi:OmpA-OmpF porin, OOP family
MKRLSLSILVAASLAASAANAQFSSPTTPPLFYIGAGVGGGNLNQSAGEATGLNNPTLDDTDTTWTFRAGWRFLPYLALEVGYYELGKYSFTGVVPGTTAVISGSAHAKSYGASLVGIIPIETVDIYGRIGYAHSRLSADAGSGNINAAAHDYQNEATYGVGARWNWTREWGVFGEWMKNDKIKVDSYMIGVDFRF